MAESEQDLCGRTLGGFLLREQLDTGGFGMVYRAYQPTLRREVVIKVLKPDMSNGAALERFRREAQLASRFSHDYVAHIYEFGIETDGELAGLCWIAMELVPGITLKDWLKKNRRMRLEDLVPFFERIAEAMKAAHELKIIHRDLKPANIMVIDREGRLFPKLLDFGIAKVNHPALFPEDHVPADYSTTLLIRGQRRPPNAEITHTKASRYDLTPRGVQCGSAPYMAPEQAVDSGDVGPAADIYSLGIVIYEALTGRRPFFGEDAAEYAELHRRADVPALGDDLPAALDAVVHKALSKESQHRQKTVMELAAELAAVLRASDREKLRNHAQVWRERGQRPGMLLAGSELKRWAADKSTKLTELECSFVGASERRARRGAWIRRAIPVAIAGAVVGLLFLRSELAKETAQQRALAATVEQGRQALLHGESGEAVHHLENAYQRGEHSRGLEFMLARAVQPRMSELGRFPSRSGRMWSAMFSPDGKQVLTADDQSARMWDARSHQLLFSMPHNDIVYQALFSLDRSRIITAGGDGTVRIWDAATGAATRVLSHSSRAVRWSYSALAISSHFVAAIDALGRGAHVWNIDNGDLIADLRIEPSELALLAISANGQWLAATSGDDVRIFNTASWQQVATITGQQTRSLTFDLNATRPLLAIGSYDGSASLWDIPMGMCLRHLRQSGESVDAIAFSPEGRLIATGSRDGSEQIWDAGSGSLRGEFNWHHDKIYGLEFSSDGTLLLSASASGAIVVSDVMTGMMTTRLEGPTKLVYSAHFDAEAHRVVGASWDGFARVWDAVEPYRRWSSPAVGPECNTAESAAPDGRFVALSCRNHGTRVWDTARDDLLVELPEVSPVEGDYFSALPVLSVAGDQAAIARGDTVEVYAIPSGHLLRKIHHAAAVNAVAFSPTGHDLISGATDGSILLSRDGRSSLALPVSHAGIDAVAILHDGRIIIADAGSRLRLLSPDGSRLMDLAAPTRIRLLRPSPNSQRLVTISVRSNQAAPILWDLVKYRVVAQLDGHTGRVFAARFVGSGNEILTAGADGTARRWSASTGRSLQVFGGDSHFLADATVSPDGALIVAGSSDGRLRFWDVSDGQLLWTLRAHKGYIIGVHYEGSELVTRGFAGDIARWSLPNPREVVDACHATSCAATPAP